jgi:DNA-directed RNA polymerase subunit RPC12/RpoP
MHKKISPHLEEGKLFVFNCPNCEAENITMFKGSGDYKCSKCGWSIIVKKVSPRLHPKDTLEDSSF